jgi:hypothetical protein
MNVSGEKYVAINFPTVEDCQKFMTYFCGKGDYSSSAVRIKVTHFEHNDRYYPGDCFIQDGLVINIEECNIKQQNSLPEIYGHKPIVVDNGELLKVGCQEIPFETVEKIYKAMVKKREE